MYPTDPMYPRDSVYYAAELAADVAASGVAVWPSLICGDQLEGLRRAVADLLEGPHALAFPKSTRVWDLYRHHAVFTELLEHHDLNAAIKNVLGEGFLLSDYSLNVVNPGQPVDDWHIDYPYNEMPRMVTGGILGVQCVLGLTDFTAANGATEWAPGSHNPPRRPDGLPPQTTRRFEAPAGSLLVMAASTWHHSGINQSAEPRAAILLSFVERWIRPMTDPPEPGPWSRSPHLRIMLGQERLPETINGVPIEDPGATV